MKKIIAAILTLTLAALMLAGCAKTASDEITVVSREDGSGTRGAFVELFKVEQKDSEGNKVDYTLETADITNSTSVMMTSVAGNKNAIGYISLGSLNSTVKALKIDGAEASAENIKSGAYKIARPFNIAVGADVSEAAKAFISFIMSADGQKVIEASGYIAIDANAQAYVPSAVSGKVAVSGSSSVTPVMEKLKEAYTAINPNAEIEVQQSDSSSGMANVKDGVCDIGMASRELKDSELEAGLTPTAIAMDGIAMIVNNENPAAELTSEAVRMIFMGEITSWSELG